MKSILLLSISNTDCMLLISKFFKDIKFYVLLSGFRSMFLFAAVIIMLKHKEVDGINDNGLSCFLPRQ